MWLRELRREHHRLAELVPWDYLETTPGVLVQKDNSLLATLQVRGPDLQSALDGELVILASRLNNLMRRFDGGWALFSEAQRREVCTYPVQSWPDPVSALVDQERRALFVMPHTHYETHMFLTFVYAPPRVERSRLAQMLYEHADAQAPAENILTFFLEVVQRAYGLLQECCPEVVWLQSTETTPGCSPLLTYLHSTVSPKQHPVGLPETSAYMDSYLTDTDIYTGTRPTWGHPEDPASFHGTIAAISVHQYPARTYPGILDVLHELPMEYRHVLRYLPLDPAQAEQEILKYRRAWRGARKRVGTMLTERMTQRESDMVDLAPLTYAEEAAEAQAAAMQRTLSFGYMSNTIICWDRNQTRLDRKVNDIEAALNALGCVAKVEDLNAFQAWLGTVPGNVYSNVRRPLMHSYNLAHCVPVMQPWRGPSWNTHLSGPPLLKTIGLGHTPFNLDTYDGDVGMAYIAGPIGAGKSTLMATMAMAWLKYPGARVRVIDTGQSMRCTTYAVGGHWYDVAEELKKTSGLGQRIDDRETKPWESPWVPQDHFWQCFEMEDLLKTPEVVEQVMRPLLQILKERMTGAPTLFLFDEAHLYLLHKTLALGIDDYLRGIRKKNGAVLLSTQSIADAARSALAPIISDSSMTRLYLPNYHALEPDTRAIYAGWGLNERQCQLIARLVPKRDYYYQGRQGHRIFQLGLGPVGLAFAGRSQKPDLAAMATMYTGDGLAFSIDWLHYCGLHQQADALKSEGGGV